MFKLNALEVIEFFRNYTIIVDIANFEYYGKTPMMFQILNLMLQKTKFCDLTKYSNLLLNNLEMLNRIVLLPQVNPP